MQSISWLAATLGLIVYAAIAWSQQGPFTIQECVDQVNKVANRIEAERSDGVAPVIKPGGPHTWKEDGYVFCFRYSKRFERRSLAVTAHPSQTPSPHEFVFADNVLNRRQFLKFQLKGALWLATGAANLFLPAALRAGATPDIAVVKGRPGAATRAAVNHLGGMQAFVTPGDKVVIKPNMSFSNGVENATNTRPEVVRELVAMAKESGASRIRVLDNPLGLSDPCIAEIKDACSMFNEDITHALTDFSFYQPAKINDSWFGFNQTDVMKDVLAADAKTVEMCSWYGKRFKARQIKHIRMAHEKGLGRMDLENLVIKQTEI